MLWVDAATRTADPAATRRELRAAMERRDLAAVVALFAPDIVLRSPIIGRPSFEGREAVANLIAAVVATFDDYEYTLEGEGEGDGVQVLAFRARVRGREIDAVDLFRMDDAGLVTEIVVHIRPMAGLAAVAAALGPHLARGPLQRVLVTAFTVPLAFVLGVVEPLIPRLVRTR